MSLNQTLTRQLLRPPYNEKQRSAEREELAQVLLSLRDQLRREAIDGVWEVSELSVEPPHTRARKRPRSAW
jgi:hypothetical protein